MLDTILGPIVNFIINIISSTGYIGIALLMAIQSAALPIPSEIIMPFTGYLVYKGQFTLMGAALAGAVGSVVGSWAIYAVAYFGGLPLIKKYGRYVFISKHSLKISEKFFKKFGGRATFIGRMLPIVRTYISIPAGVSRAPLVPFTIAAFIGSFIWSYFLAYLGYKFGQNWQDVNNQLKGFDTVIAIAIIIGIAWFIWHHVKNRPKK